MRDFETAYQKWLEAHWARRTGERKRRLKEGHGFGEKLLVEHVWWPVIGNFDDLHPEYEFVDEDGNHYFMDLAYVRFPRPTTLEADGFATHARDADRREFSKDRRRQNAIGLDDWNILRFSTDDLKEDLPYCRKTLIRMMEQWYGEDPEPWLQLPLRQRELLRLATRSKNPIQPADAAACLGTGDRVARDLLHQLVDQGYLESASGTDKRIHSYRLVHKKNQQERFR